METQCLQASSVFLTSCEHAGKELCRKSIKKAAAEGRCRRGVLDSVSWMLPVVVSSQFRGPCDPVFPAFRGVIQLAPNKRDATILCQNVKLTNALVVLSEFLRVESVRFLSERSVGRLGAVFGRCRVLNEFGCAL